MKNEKEVKAIIESTIGWIKFQEDMIKDREYYGMADEDVEMHQKVIKHNKSTITALEYILK